MSTFRIVKIKKQIISSARQSKPAKYRIAMNLSAERNYSSLSSNAEGIKIASKGLKRCGLPESFIARKRLFTSPRFLAYPLPRRKWRARARAQRTRISDNNNPRTFRLILAAGQYAVGRRGKTSAWRVCVWRAKISRHGYETAQRQNRVTALLRQQLQRGCCICSLNNVGPCTSCYRFVEQIRRSHFNPLIASDICVARRSKQENGYPAKSSLST